MEGFYHMGKMQSHGWSSRYENPKFFIEFLFKRKRLNSQNKFEREPTEKKFQKIKHQSLKKIKSLPKQRKFLRGMFFWKKIKWPLFKNHKVFDKNQIKILECHTIGEIWDAMDLGGGLALVGLP